jgi:hypothetical protein
VGMTNASASKVLNKKASINATTIDSMVSRVPDGRGPPPAAEAGAADRLRARDSCDLAGSGEGLLVFVVDAIEK